LNEIFQQLLLFMQKRGVGLAEGLRAGGLLLRSRRLSADIPAASRRTARLN
jgi:hypothetical protein